MRALWFLLRHGHDFRRLVSAGLISLTGDWILRVGVAYYVYQLTGSTLASAGTLLSSFAPRILFSSFAGVFVDRWNRKTIMIVANLLMAGGLAPLLMVNHPDDVWIMYAVTAWEGFVELFSVPAEQAMVPRLVNPADLVTANALNGQIREVARLVGSAIGGLVVATGGITALALADAATFVVAAVLVGGIRASGQVGAAGTPPPEEVEDRLAITDLDALEEPWGPDGAAGVLAVPERSHAAGQSLMREWSEGLRIAGSRPALRAVFAYTLIVMTGEGIMGTLFVPFVRDVLHGGSQTYGFVVSVQAIGGITGGVVAASLGQRVSPAVMFGIGGFLFGLIDLVMFVYPLAYVAVWPAAACMVVVGLPGAVAMTGYNTLLQRHTSDAYRGRVFGALGAVQGIAIVIGTLGAGFLGESVGIVPILSLHGLGAMAAGVIVLVILRHELPMSADEAMALSQEG